MARLLSALSTVLVLFMVAAACVVDARQFPRWHQLESIRYDFRAFTKDANRQYAHGSPEWLKRQAIFNARLKSIKEHNANPAHTWKRGINEFADWTEHEWRSYNRARPTTDAEYARMPAKLYEFAASNPTELPKTVDYRLRTDPPVLTGIKNQGSCGSCWAHAATEELESFFAIRYGQLPVLSTQQVTSCTTTESGCGGGGFGNAWQSAQIYGGVNEEWTYPYVDFFAPAMTKQNTAACQNTTAKFPIINAGTSQAFLFTWWPKVNVSSFVRIPRNNASAVMTALAKEGPLAMTVASTQWSDYESGVLVNNYTNAASNASWQSLDHDVQLVGYGYDFDLNVNYWVARNSWGTNYGENGFIRLLRPDVEPCGDVFGVEVCGTSGMLYNLAYPEVKPLEKQNGYYF